MTKRERPQIIVIKSGGHGCLISVLLLIFAWPLAIIYWLVLLVKWAVLTTIDWLTLGPLRRRR